MTEFRSKNFTEFQSRVNGLKHRHDVLLREKLDYYRLPKVMRQERQRQIFK